MISHCTWHSLGDFVEASLHYQQKTGALSDVVVVKEPDFVWSPLNLTVGEVNVMHNMRIVFVESVYELVDYLKEFTENRSVFVFGLFDTLDYSAQDLNLALFLMHKLHVAGADVRLGDISAISGSTVNLLGEEEVPLQLVVDKWVQRENVE